MEPLTITTSFARGDVPELLRVGAPLVPEQPEKWNSQAGMWRFWVALPGFLVLLALRIFTSPGPVLNVVLCVVFGFFILWTAFLLLNRYAMYDATQRLRGTLVGQNFTLTLNDSGTSEVRVGGELPVEHGWETFTLVKASPGFYVLFSGEVPLVYVPRRCLGAGAAAFEQYLDVYLLGRDVAIYRYLE